VELWSLSGATMSIVAMHPAGVDKEIQNVIANYYNQLQ
jgi:hypothetical protein